MSMTAGFTDPAFGGYPQGAPLPTLGQILGGDAPASSPPLAVATPPTTRATPRPTCGPVSVEPGQGPAPRSSARDRSREPIRPRVVLEA